MDCDSPNCGMKSKENRLNLALFYRPVVCAECNDVLKLSRLWNGIALTILVALIYGCIMLAPVLGNLSWVLLIFSFLVVLVPHWLFSPMRKVSKDKINQANKIKLIIVVIFAVIVAGVVYFYTSSLTSASTLTLGTLALPSAS